jgi:hypothetical protein
MTEEEAQAFKNELERLNKEREKQKQESPIMRHLGKLVLAKAYEYQEIKVLSR